MPHSAGHSFLGVVLSSATMQWAEREFKNEKQFAWDCPFVGPFSVVEFRQNRSVPSCSLINLVP